MRGSVGRRAVPVSPGGRLVRQVLAGQALGICDVALNFTTAVGLGALSLLTGIVMYKPAQFSTLAVVFGDRGASAARRRHPGRQAVSRSRLRLHPWSGSKGIERAGHRRRLYTLHTLSEAIVKTACVKSGDDRHALPNLHLGNL